MQDSAVTADRDERMADERLFAPRYRALTLATLALVTLGAYENRATTTVLPLVAEDLDGLRWFGLASAMSAITFLIASAVAGVWTDHIGPRRILAGALATLVVAQVVAGLAPDMSVFLTGRALSGIGEGAMDVALIVLVADLMPDAVRAKLFAAIATAWILPSLIGPGIAGGIADLWGWRASFLVPVVLALPAALVLRPVLARAHGREPRPWTETERRSIIAAAVVAVGIALLTWGSAAAASGSRVGLILTLAAVVLVAVRLAGALPAGALRLAAGAPALVAVTMLVNAAFAALGTYLPLLLTTVRGEPAALAGVSLTITGVFWAAGSNLASRPFLRERFRPGRMAAAGMVLMVLGGVGPLLLALDVLTLAPAMVIFALACVGMGVTNNVLSVHLVAIVAPDERGRYAASRTIAAAVGAAAATAVGGALVAAEADDLTASPIAITVAAGIVVAAVTGFAALRVDR